MKVTIISMVLFMMNMTVLSGQIEFLVHNPCDGKKDGSITASVGIPGLFRYKINDGNNIFKESGTFNNLAAGSYTITVFDLETYCEFSKDTILVGKNAPSISISGGGSFGYCVNIDGPPKVLLESLAGGGTPPYSYNWSNGSLVVSSSGLYKAMVTDANQCKAETEAFVAIVPVICLVSLDPNDINGPAGYESPQWVSQKDSLPYRVRFENDQRLATGAAKKVLLDVPLESDIALNSFRIGSFGFANLTFNVPPNRTFYQARVDARDSLGVFVDVNIGVDIINRKAFWIFQAIDPATGLPPDQSVLGMLPVNDSLTQRGEGFVDFLVKPSPTTVTGDIVSAQASIVFDQNASIETNTWQNTIDAVPPSSSLHSLPTQTPDTSFPVTWEGADDIGGSGIKNYSLYVSQNGGSFVQYESGITNTFLQFNGEAGSSYSFYVRAKDNTGNEEPKKTTGSTPIFILPTSGGDIQLFAKAYLSGVFDQTNGLMKDDLRQLSLLPLVQPYTTTLGYTHTGTESVASSVFAVTGSDAIVDWVLVELRDKADGGQLLFSRSALLQRDGDIVATDGISPLTFTGAPADDYYVVVRHRNHLGIGTKTPVALGFVPLALDFSDGSVQTFGTDAQANIGGKFLLWSGDANGDRKVIYAGSGTDVNAVSAKVFTNPLNTTFSPSFPFLGYDRADLNLDGKVIYAGAGTDVNFISLPVFTFPLNVGLSPTYVLLGQLP